jgi:geranylgeranyl diphosphate synthase type II
MKPPLAVRRYEALRGKINRALMMAAGKARPLPARSAIRHILAAGGKRTRPVLLLLAAECVGGRLRDAIHAAVAVELLHSFTLVHDDIMDNAPTRRGRPTVHTKWGIGYGILSGDILLGLAYESLLRVPGGNPSRLTGIFTTALLDVCEGQSVDLAFEGRKNVSPLSYFRMIGKKTAALFALSTAMGGHVASAGASEIAALSRYGRHLGLAFQVQDDLLDIVAEEQTFGKIVGGDLYEGKKTFLLLHAARKARGEDRRKLSAVLSGASVSRRTVAAITDIYRRLGTLKAAEATIQRETARARKALSSLPDNRARAMLDWIAAALAGRRF